jgi:hypothetical protein
LAAGVYELRVAVTVFATGAYQNVELFMGRTTTIEPLPKFVPPETGIFGCQDPPEHGFRA